MQTQTEEAKALKQLHSGSLLVGFIAGVALILEVQWWERIKGFKASTAKSLESKN